MLVITHKVKTKLNQRHNVKESEIIEAFANREKGFLTDSREEHRSDPPTEWFVAETDFGRKLKVCFVNAEGNIHIKTAYTATEQICDIYNRHA